MAVAGEPPISAESNEAAEEEVDESEEEESEEDDSDDDGEFPLGFSFLSLKRPVVGAIASFPF